MSVRLPILWGQFKCSLIVISPNAGQMDCKVTEGGGQGEGKKKLPLAITRRLW